MPNDVEEKAISIVTAYEKKEGREGRDARKDKPKTGVDVVSSGRFIEVKGSTCKNPCGVNLGCYNIKAFKKYRDKYWLSVVYDISANPKAVMFNHKHISERKTPHTSWYVHFGKKERGESINVSKLSTPQKPE